MIRTKRLNAINLMVRNLERSLAWYQDHFGFTRLYNVEGGVLIGRDGVEIILSPAANPSLPNAHPTTNMCIHTLAFEVTDDELDRVPNEFDQDDEIVKIGHPKFRSHIVEDPDGYCIELYVEKESTHPVVGIEPITGAPWTLTYKERGMDYETIHLDDVNRCAEIFVHVFNSSLWNEDWDVRSASHRLTEIVGTPGFMGLQVVSEQRIVGFVMGYLETFDTGGDFYLKEMCIFPGMQRQGIGTALIEELKRHLARSGARKLYLLTARGSVAERFYEKNGFYTSETMIMMGHWPNSK